jgi:hypothetical protein
VGDVISDPAVMMLKEDRANCVRQSLRLKTKR